MLDSTGDSEIDTMSQNAITEELDAKADTTYVDDQDALLMPKTGGSFTGRVRMEEGLFMDSTRIEYVALPIDDSDAANKQYVDNGLADKFDKSGGLIDGAVEVSGSLLADNGLTVEDSDFSTIHIKDNSGGNLELKGLAAPSSDTDAATKKYVDDAAKLTEITWSDLKALRDNGNLIPGKQYRRYCSIKK